MFSYPKYSENNNAKKGGDLFEHPEMQNEDLITWTT